MTEPNGDQRFEPGTNDALTPRAADSSAEATAVDPFEAELQAELERIRNPKANWTQAVLVLAVSFMLFTALGLRDKPFAFGILIAVLLFHELGHFIGMRIFGYRNVRIFFIPLFGAAVSGQKSSAKSYQEAIVTLLGPLPGLILSSVLLVLALNLPDIAPQQRRLLLHTSALFGLINAFNIFPVYPLDGGRLLNLVLFSRNRFLEGIFQVVAAIALLVYGQTHSAPMLFILGIWMLIAVRPRFRENTIARNVGKRFDGQLPALNDPIPSPIFQEIVAQTRELLPAPKTNKVLAGTIYRIWEKIHVEPPGFVATFLLLAAYLVAVALTIPWLQFLLFPTAR